MAQATSIRGDGGFSPHLPEWLTHMPEATPVRRPTDRPAVVAPFRLEMEQLLSEWRAAERRLDGLGLTGSAAAQVLAEIDGLRVRHQRLFALARASISARLVDSQSPPDDLIDRLRAIWSQSLAARRDVATQS